MSIVVDPLVLLETLQNADSAVHGGDKQLVWLVGVKVIRTA
jgi:hypothetical protein